jgi:hypothetical protein
MLSNLNHDHGRKKKFETWKEKVEKKFGRLKKNFSRSDLYAEEGLSYISAILCFLGAWKLGCLHPLHSQHLKTQNSLKDWPFSYTK